MNKLSKEEEMTLLSKCIHKNLCTEFVQRYYNLGRFIVIKIYSSKHIHYTKEDIEDRVQEIFEKLFEKDKKKLKQYQPNGGLSLTSWVTLIASQTIISYLRTNKEIADEKKIPVDEFESVLSDPIEKGRIDARQKLNMVQNVLKRLDPDAQIVLKLEWFYGSSPSQIAQLLHTTVSNIYTIKSRAIDRIKEDLEKIRREL